jgi:hypothetical protein
MKGGFAFCPPLRKRDIRIVSTSAHEYNLLLLPLVNDEWQMISRQPVNALKQLLTACCNIS